MYLICVTKVFMGYLVWKMKYITFIVRLQGKQNITLHYGIFRTKKIAGYLQCITTLPNFKHSKIFIFHWGALQDVTLDRCMYYISRLFTGTHKIIQLQYSLWEKLLEVRFTLWYEVSNWRNFYVILFNSNRLFYLRMEFCIRFLKPFPDVLE